MKYIIVLFTWFLLSINLFAQKHITVQKVNGITTIQLRNPGIIQFQQFLLPFLGSYLQVRKTMINRK